MPTPSIQTLINDAQQVLNLDSISAVRSVVAVSLANANTGTPLNPNLTTQQLWNEFYQVVTRSKSDIESIIANQLMKFLYSPPAPGGVGANKQVIFNDGGVLAGDAGLTYDKATDALTVGGNLTLSAGTALGVGYLNASKVLTAGSALIFDGTNLGIGGTGQLRFATSGGAIGDNYIGTENSFSMKLHCGRGSTSSIELASDKLLFYTSASERYRIANDGVATWSNVGGVAGTAMTLNSTGLGVGGPPAAGMLLTVGGTSSVSATANALQVLSSKGTFNVVTDGSTNAAGTTITYSWANGGQGPLIFRNASVSNVMTLSASGNVGIGVTPSALTNVNRLEIGGQLSSNVTLRSTSTSSSARNWMVGANVNAFGDFVIRQGNSQGAEPNSGTDRLVIDLDGNPIFTPSSTPATLTTNGQLTVNATSNTNLRFSYRGSDGVTRVANITLA